MLQQKGKDLAVLLVLYARLLLFPYVIPKLRHRSRYLTAVDFSYYDGLSDASKQSLVFQGGPFKGDDLEAFEHHPLKDEMVRLRKWDDMSKIVGITEQTQRAAIYAAVIRKHLERPVD